MTGRWPRPTLLYRGLTDDLCWDISKLYSSSCQQILPLANMDTKHREQFSILKPDVQSSIPTLNPKHNCGIKMSLQRRSTTTRCCGSSTRFASASHKSAFKFGSINTPRLTPSSSPQRSRSKSPTLPVEVMLYLSDNQIFCLYLHQHTILLGTILYFINGSKFITTKFDGDYWPWWSCKQASDTMVTAEFKWTAS